MEKMADHIDETFSMFSKRKKVVKLFSTGSISFSFYWLGLEMVIIYACCLFSSWLLYTVGSTTFLSVPQSSLHSRNGTTRSDTAKESIVLIKLISLFQKSDRKDISAKVLQQKVNRYREFESSAMLLVS